MSRSISLLVSTAILVSLVTLSQRGEGALINGDFQAPNISGLSTGTVPTGWTYFNAAGGGGTNFGMRDDGPLADMSRDQFFWHNIRLVGAAAELFQDTGDVIVAGTTYTLSVDVGEQSNQPASSLGRIKLYGSALGRSSPFAELDMIDPGLNGQSTWTTFMTSFTATPAQAGQTLGVALGFASDAPTGSTLNASYDNVQLSISAIPEPESFALAAFGVIGLIALMRVRRRRTSGRM